MLTTKKRQCIIITVSDTLTIESEVQVTRKLTWKEAREKAGMSQAKVAKEVGMSVQSYNQKENYQRSMKLSEGLLVCKVLGTKIEDMKIA